MSEEVKEPSVDILSNISKNKKRSKKRDWNDYGLVTRLVEKYKKSNNENDLLEVIKALEGIINTYTIIITPGNASQQIFLNPYMKKFLYLFLSPEEKANLTYQTYMQAVYRIRWIMRHFSYEDIYNMVISIITETVRKMQVIEGCDCIYYIQFITKFQLHSRIMKHSNDAIVNVKDMPDKFEDENGETNDQIDRLNYYYSSLVNDEEDKILNSIYDNIQISALVREDDIFKCLTYYEKYILYMIEYLGLDTKQILSVLKYETQEELNERIEDILYKIKILSNE